jgi:predicted TPR repeat methyltransferase
MLTKRHTHFMSQVTVLRRRASELAFLGKNKKAARLYEQILELAPSDPQIALKLGEVRRKTGDLPGAQAAYERAAALFSAIGLDSKADAAMRMAQEVWDEQQEQPSIDLPWWKRWFGNA